MKYCKIIVLALFFLFSIKPETVFSLNHKEAHGFSSGIYDSYLEQLQLFIGKEKIKYPNLQPTSKIESHSEFTIEGLKLIKFISSAQKTMAPLEKTEFHKTMIEQLRKVIFLKEKMNFINDPISTSLMEFINDFTLWMYTTPELLLPMQNFMSEAFPTAFPSNINADAWVEQLSTLYNTIDTTESLDGLPKIPGMLYDAHLHGDIPTVIYTFSTKDKNIKVVRTANTTYDRHLQHGSNAVTTEIIPEFTHYIQTIAKQGKKHLYINYIARQRNSDHNEATVIENLEKDLLYRSALSVISIARNSAFYNQLEPYSEISSAEAFKTAFIAELFADESTGHYHWPLVMDRTAWKDTAIGILNVVHANYFDGSSTMTVDERKQFIDVAYVKMTEYLINFLQPDVVNLSCAISIERGPVAYTLLYIDLLLQQKEQIDLNDLQVISTLVYGPGAIFRNRSIDPNHNYRFINGAHRLQLSKMHSQQL